jgi:hypothetical protein
MWANSVEGAGHRWQYGACALHSGYLRLQIHTIMLCRVQLKCDGTWWRTGGEVKGKLANGMGSQYPSHYLGTWSSITTADVHTSAASSRLNWRPPPVLNGIARFAERRNLVSARVPSHFKRSLLLIGFSTTSVVARKLNVTSYVYWLSCFL